jgi:hypothetical protein
VPSSEKIHRRIDDRLKLVLVVGRDEIPPRWIFHHYAPSRAATCHWICWNAGHVPFSDQVLQRFGSLMLIFGVLVYGIPQSKQAVF